MPIGACWFWKAGHKSDGYGVIGVKGKCLTAHRIMWQMENGPIPKGMHVLHKCDKPNCVNPRHLFLGTHADNMADMGRKGRAGVKDQNGQKNDSAKLTDEQVKEIRRLAESGMTQKSIAKKFNVSRANVCVIVNRKRWAHL